MFSRIRTVFDVKKMKTLMANSFASSGIIMLRKVRLAFVVMTLCGIMGCGNTDRSNGADSNVQSENGKQKKLSPDEIRRSVDRLRELGLLEHLSENEFKASMDTLKMFPPSDRQGILWHFPRTVFFEGDEMLKYNRPYEKATRMIADISKGSFQPTDIIDEFDINKDEPFYYGFTANDKSYSMLLENLGNDYDNQYITLIQDAMKDSDSERKLYWFPIDGDMLIFLTPAQHESMKAEGLHIVAEEDFYWLISYD